MFCASRWLATMETMETMERYLYAYDDGIYVYGDDDGDASGWCGSEQW